MTPRPRRDCLARPRRRRPNPQARFPNSEPNGDFSTGGQTPIRSRIGVSGGLSRLEGLPEEAGRFAAVWIAKPFIEGGRVDSPPRAGDLDTQAAPASGDR